MAEVRPIRVALLGAGSVGSQVARLMHEHAEELAERVGYPLELAGVLVRDVNATRDSDIPAELLTTEADALIHSSDIVVELMGGIEPAKEYLLTALRTGADVVTANKALLSEAGNELFDVAERVGAQLYFEAAVAAAIPIVRPLQESFAGDRLQRVLGIVNGSTNFILDQMDRFGTSLESAMAEARELGFLEADPTLDIEGYDAAQKAALLASLAFHTLVTPEDVYREGITGVTSELIADAKSNGYVVKLLAIADRIEEDGQERVSARVHPALIPADHPLAAVHGGNNAVFVHAEFSGDLMFYGAGAGGVPTAAAVLGDLVTAARRRVLGGPGLVSTWDQRLDILNISEIETKYLVRIEVTDAPGVLASIARILSDKGISVATLNQSASANPSRATIIIGTHRAQEASMRAAVTELTNSDSVFEVTSVTRVEA